jgi:hypothetical protein
VGGGGGEGGGEGCGVGVVGVVGGEDWNNFGLNCLYRTSTTSRHHLVFMDIRRNVQYLVRRFQSLFVGHAKSPFYFAFSAFLIDWVARPFRVYCWVGLAC